MKLKGIDFGAAWAASGAQGFFGEGYWWHKLVPGLSWKGATFVAKTTTLHARKGNMPLKRDWSPRGLFPDCVRVKFWDGAALNAVGLSGPGLEALLDTGRWQARTEPFFLSFMSVAPTRDERFKEVTQFSQILNSRLHEFKAPVGIQVNLSCPNAGLDPSELVGESAAFLALMQVILPREVPLVAKINVLFPPELAAQLRAHCDAICVSNTIPWGKLDDKIWWWKYFPPKMNSADAEHLWDINSAPFSPLAKYGGGGLSGAPLLPLVADWVAEAKVSGIELPINAGGGILGPKDVDVLVGAGADSVSLGTIAMLRGWRLRRTIRRARRVTP